MTLQHRAGHIPLRPLLSAGHSPTMPRMAIPPHLRTHTLSAAAQTRASSGYSTATVHRDRLSLGSRRGDVASRHWPDYKLVQKTVSGARGARGVASSSRATAAASGGSGGGAGKDVMSGQWSISSPKQVRGGECCLSRVRACARARRELGLIVPVVRAPVAVHYRPGAGEARSERCVSPSLHSLCETKQCCGRLASLQRLNWPHRAGARVHYPYSWTLASRQLQR